MLTRNTCSKGTGSPNSRDRWRWCPNSRGRTATGRVESVTLVCLGPTPSWSVAETHTWKFVGRELLQNRLTDERCSELNIPYKLHMRKKTGWHHHEWREEGIARTQAPTLVK